MILGVLSILQMSIIDSDSHLIKRRRNHDSNLFTQILVLALLHRAELIEGIEAITCKHQIVAWFL